MFFWQMDYRSLVHEKDEAAYSEIRVIMLDIRGFYVSCLHLFIQQTASKWEMLPIHPLRMNHDNCGQLYGWRFRCLLFLRLNCMMSSARTWRKWRILKEKRSPPCTETDAYCDQHSSTTKPVFTIFHFFTCFLTLYRYIFKVAC